MADDSAPRPSPAAQPARPAAWRGLLARAARRTVRAVDSRAADADTVANWARRQLGDVVADTPALGGQGGGAVVRLERSDGMVVYAKQPTPRLRFRNEHEALRSWTPALGDHAPQLLAADARRRFLIMTRVAGTRVGRTPSARQPAVHRAAGAWLARLHASDARPIDDVREHLAERLARTYRRDPGVLSAVDRSFLDDLVHTGPSQPGHLVRCHGDFGPHNWMLDTDGTLGVIDFGFAGYRLAAWDLATLATRHWPGRRRLQLAFLKGYGVTSDAEWLALIRTCAALHAASVLVGARGANRPDLERRHRVALDDLRAASTPAPDPTATPTPDPDPTPDPTPDPVILE